MDQAPHPGFARLLGNTLRPSDVHGMERIRSALNVEAHRVDDAKRPFDRCRDGWTLADIDANGPEFRIICTRCFWGPRCNANREAFVPQMTRDPASQEASAAQNGYDIAHGPPIRDYAAS